MCKRNISEGSGWEEMMLLRLACFILIPFWFIINNICWVLRLTSYKSYDTMLEGISGAEINMTKKTKNLPDGMLKWKLDKLLQVNEMLQNLRRTSDKCKIYVVDFKLKKLLGRLDPPKE